jgi:hypothetical protein
MNIMLSKNPKPDANSINDNAKKFFLTVLHLPKRNIKEKRGFVMPRIFFSHFGNNFFRYKTPYLLEF